MDSEPTTVHVGLSDRAYDIEISAGNLKNAGYFIRSRSDAQYAVVITDENVDDPHAENVSDSLLDSDFAAGASLFFGDAVFLFDFTDFSLIARISSQF